MPRSSIEPREILLVDDDRTVCDCIRWHLQRCRLPHRLVQFAEAAAAWTHLVDAQQQGHLPALCLLDAELPGDWTAKDLLRRIKRRSDLRRLPVVVLSASDDPRQVLECYLLGCTHYLPTDGSHLPEMMDRLDRCLAELRLP